MGNQLAAFDHAVNHPKPHLPSHAHAYSSQFPCSMVVSPPRDVAVARFARGCLLARLDVDPLRACCRLSPRGALEKSALPPPPPPFSLDPLHQPEPSNPPMFLSFTRCGCVAISPTQGAGTERAAGVAQRLSGFQGVIIHRLPPLPLTESSPSSHLFETPFWEPRMCFGIISRNLINPLTNPR